MGYGGDPSNSASDALRLLIHDTGTPSVLSDGEIEWFLAGASNVWFAAANAADAISASHSGDVTTRKVGDLTLVTQSAAQYTSLAAQLRQKGARAGVAPYAGGISVADKAANRSDTDWDRGQAVASDPAVWG